MVDLNKALIDWSGRLKTVVSQRPWLPFLFLFILGLLVYLNALPNQLFWDDYDSLLNNYYIKDWSYFGRYFTENLIAGAGLMSNYWRPLLLVIYSIEWHIWGDWATGYHLVSILIHLAAGLVLYDLLKKITDRPIIAWLASLIFLIHPLQTEAVTYVAGRGDPLSVLFLSLSLLWYWRSRFKETISYKKRHWFIGSIIALVAAILTKDKSIIMPALLLLMEFYVWQQNKTVGFKDWLKQVLKNTWLYWLIIVFYLYLRATVLNFQDTFNIYGQASVYTESLAIRLWTWLSVWPQYLKLFFVPVGLHMERLVDIKISWLAGDVLLGIGLVILLAVIMVVSWRRKFISAFGLLWLGIALAPASGVVIPVSGLMYEHYMYLPLLGLAIFLMFWGDVLIKKFPLFLKISCFGLLMIWLVWLGVRTIERNADWRTPIVFYEDVLRYNQQSLRIWNNYGMALSDVESYQAAAQAYQRAINLNKDNQSAPPYHNLGNALIKLNKPAEAIKNYQQAILIDDQFYYSYNSLAALYLTTKDYQSARQILEQGLKAMPGNSLLAYNLQIVEQLELAENK
ncbi:tetratricopeptide repeat protein [Patescibacteria group bacterium]|nr:tetratricopeptide repeat protein [Patescibacteria group bacterium]